MDKIPDHYDVIIVGSGLAESVAAGAISRSEKTVLHIDPNEFYGLHQASLDLVGALGLFSGAEGLTVNNLFKACYRDITIDVAPEEGHSREFVDDLGSNPKAAKLISDILGIQPGNLSKILEDGSAADTGVSSKEAGQISCLHGLIGTRIDYGIEISPRVFLSGGEVVETLIRTGIGRFLGFSPLGGIYTDYKNEIQRLVLSPKSLFSVKAFSPVEKRLIMRAVKTISESQDAPPEPQDLSFVEHLRSIGLDYDLSVFLASVPAASRGDCVDLPYKEGLEKSNRLLGSISPATPNGFLVGHYGATSEILQTFCRYSAVYGGVYILSEKIDKIHIGTKNTVAMSDGALFYADKIILSATYSRLVEESEQWMLKRCIAILTGPVLEGDTRVSGHTPGNTLLVLKKGFKDNSHPTTVLQLTASSRCCPADKCVLYLASRASKDPKSDLFGILDYLIGRCSPGKEGLRPTALVKIFYTQDVPEVVSEQQLSQESALAFANSDLSMFRFFDQEIEEAKRLFLWANPSGETEFLPMPPPTDDDSE